MQSVQSRISWPSLARFLAIGFFALNCASGPHFPQIEVEEKDGYTFIQVEDNILQGSIYDLDNNQYDQLRLDPWMYKYNNGRVILYLAATHITKTELYTSTSKSLTLLVDGERFQWDSPGGQVHESYLRKVNLKTGHEDIIHYQGVSLFSLLPEQLEKLSHATDVTVQSIGTRERTNWSFGVTNRQIVRRFYTEFFQDKTQENP